MNLPKKGCSRIASAMKNFFLEKGTPHNLGRRKLYALAPLETHVGVCAFSMFASKWFKSR